MTDYANLHRPSLGQVAITLSAFALGFILFLVTLALNFVALSVVKRYREAYE